MGSSERTTSNVCVNANVMRRPIPRSNADAKVDARERLTNNVGWLQPIKETLISGLILREIREIIC